jgi:hypothetical protein
MGIENTNVRAIADAYDQTAARIFEYVKIGLLSYYLLRLFPRPLGTEHSPR